MRLFDDDQERPSRPGGDWQAHRAHRDVQSGPPQDEVGVLALSSFQLSRTDEVVVAVRGITAYSDGLLLAVAVLFADAQRSEELGWAMEDFSRSPGRFRFGCVLADGRSATSGTRGAPTVQVPGAPALVLLHARAGALVWDGSYWLSPLPPPGTLVLGCRWPDRGIEETLVEIDAGPLVTAAATSGPVWQSPPTVADRS